MNRVFFPYTWYRRISGYAWYIRYGATSGAIGFLMLLWYALIYSPLEVRLMQHASL